MSGQAHLHASGTTPIHASGFWGRLRTLLILGRVSNLPTVWSNLIAGWWITGGIYGDGHRLLLLLAGGSLLYTGGMYLNDFCDAAFDARYCPERPIPAGRISRKTVGILACLWFFSGWLCLVTFGLICAGIGILLIAAIVLYDFRHKQVSWAPLTMGVCRILLYPLAGSAFFGGNQIMSYSLPPPAVLNGTTLYLSTSTSQAEFIAEEGWQMTLVALSFGVPLGLYVAGITYLARGESRPDKPARWALLLILAPMAAALVSYFLGRDGSTYYLFFPVALLFLLGLCFLQLNWLVWLLIPLWRRTNPSIGRVVSGLLAGIVLVDMIAVAPVVGPVALYLFPLFALALLLQLFIPAT